MANWLAAFQGRLLTREEVMRVATQELIWCCGHVRRTNMESLFWRGEAEEQAPRHPSLALPFSGPALSHRAWFLWLWLDAPPQNFLLTPLSGAPQNCFQSGPALAKAGPAHVVRLRSVTAVSSEAECNHSKASLLNFAAWICNGMIYFLLCAYNALIGRINGCWMLGLLLTSKSGSRWLRVSNSA